MKKESRYFGIFSVALFMVLLAQSSLGTTYAKADLSNAMGVSLLSTNGYARFNNGLLIQFGTSNNATVGNVKVYLPISFYDTLYSMIPSIMTDSGEYATRAAMPYNKTTTSFSVRRRYVTEEASGDNASSIMWIAIGRWK